MADTMLDVARQFRLHWRPRRGDVAEAMADFAQMVLAQQRKLTTAEVINEDCLPCIKWPTEEQVVAALRERIEKEK